MRLRQRLAFATIGALATSTALVMAASADASFVPGVSPETAPASVVDSLVIPLALVAVAVLGAVVVARTRASRAGFGIVVAIGGFLVGMLFVLSGLFGDLSGNHQVFVVPLLLGMAIVAGSGWFAWRQLRRGSTDRREAADAPPSP